MTTDNNPLKPWGMEINTFCMVMHLSQLLSFVVPFSGLVLPIVMWATNKDQFPIVDQHGKAILNWIISATIYGFVAVILMVIGIGFLLLLALAICTIVFAIIGGIKANEGVVWGYPISIKIFKPAA